MQIAGNKCKVCGKEIILSSEGKFCARCEVVTHLTCEMRTNCDVCGEPYQAYERCKADPKSEGLLPRALRPVNLGAPVLMFIAVLAFLIMVALYLIKEGLENAHGK